jgi:hypothetical protein
MKKIATTWVFIITILCIIAISTTGCRVREAERVSYNISKQADNFNVTRRLTVFNMRTDKCIMQMTGKMSIQNEGNNEISVIVEVDRKRNVYQKHLIYLNEWTMYTVEDVSGANVSKYAYEMEFMPQTLIPVKITADELGQDIADIYNDETEGETE